MRGYYFTCLVFAILLLVPTSGLNSYDEVLAKELMQAAGASYCKNADQVTLTCGVHCDYIKSKGYKVFYTYEISDGWFTKEGFSIYYSESLNRVVFAFRGTENPFQLVQEVLKDYPVAYTLQPDVPSDVYIEYFFYNRYTVYLRDKFLPQVALAKSTYPTAEFLITGHSLGGALAILSAYDLVKGGYFKKQELLVYTYGCPRVGNYEFSQAYNREGPVTNRVAHFKDIVPHVPPCTSVNGKCATGKSKSSLRGIIWYSYHTDQEILYTNEDMKDGEYKICTNEDMTCGNSYNIITCGIGDHHNYFGVRVSCPNDKP